MAAESLMKQFLTPSLREKLGRKRTKYGADLNLCIKSGEEIPESKQGIFASDPDAYCTFSELFDQIISNTHGLLETDIHQPQPHFGDPKHSDLDLSEYDVNGHIISTRVRVARNLEGFAFSTFINKERRLEVEGCVQDALSHLPPTLQGRYYNLADMSDTVRDDMVKEHILYAKGDRYLESAGCYRDWPMGRGIFTSTSGDVIVWVNEEDHIRVIAMSPGCDVGLVYGKLFEAVESLNLQFAHDQKYGYLTLCPTNLGTTLRASVLIQLHKVPTLGNFHRLCAALHLDVRGTHGEYTEVEDHIYDISNRRRMGLTEFDAVREMVHGIRILLLLEESL